MTIYPALNDHVEFLRANSRFYKELYDGLTGPFELTDLPIVDQAEFWAANTLADNQLLTGPVTDGIIFKTGGTSGAPRMSVYTREEWREMTRTFATGLAAAGVRPGDRVANLYNAGELYSGFIFTLNVLQEALTDTVQLPIAGNSPLEFAVQAMLDFDATVVAGFPTYLVELARFVREGVGTLPGVRLLLFSGEPFYDDQRAGIAAAFPNAVVRSIGYGSVDGGALGAPVDGEDVRVFRGFGGQRVLEIVDEDTSEPITAPGRPGRLLLTDLGRRLLPTVRFPVGDLAEWTDYATRTFRLLGRAGEGARVARITLHLDYLRKAVNEALGDTLVDGFQVVLRRASAQEQLVLRIAADVPDRTAADADLRARVDEIIPRFADQVRKGICPPLQVEWVAPEGIVTNHRTGKALRLIDERPV